MSWSCGEWNAVPLYVCSFGWFRLLSSLRGHWFTRSSVISMSILISPLRSPWCPLADGGIIKLYESNHFCSGQEKYGYVHQPSRRAGCGRKTADNVLFVLFLVPPLKGFNLKFTPEKWKSSTIKHRKGVDLNAMDLWFFKFSNQLWRPQIAFSNPIALFEIYQQIYSLNLFGIFGILWKVFKLIHSYI